MPYRVFSLGVEMWKSEMKEATRWCLADANSLKWPNQF